MKLAHEGSEFFFVTFDHYVRLANDLTTDMKAIESAIEATTIGGGTSLYDAIVQALEVSRKAQWARQALVIISDGADTASDRTLHQALDVIRRSDAFVYAIAIDSASSRASTASKASTNGRCVPSA